MKNRDPVLADALSRKGTVKRAAEVCGISPAAVCQWRRVPEKHVPAIAGEFGINPNSLRPDVSIASSSVQASAT